MKRKKLHNKLIQKYPESTVYAWLNGRRTPNLKTIVSINKSFKVPVNAWLDIKSYLHPNNTPTNHPTTTTQGQQ